MVKLYFTFGYDTKYPFKSNEYIVIEALTYKDVITEFKNRYPNPKDNSSEYLNCEFYYNENEWNEVVSRSKEDSYVRKEPKEYIKVEVNRNNVRTLVEKLVYTSWNSFILSNDLREVLDSKGDNIPIQKLINQIRLSEIKDIDEIMLKLDEIGYFEEKLEEDMEMDI